MPRIKLEPLAAYTFVTTVNVRVTDVNYGGHLANNAVAGLLHQARIEVLRELGLTEMDLGDGKTGLVMTDMAVSFGAEAFMNDELTVESEFAAVKRTTFRMSHRLSRDAAVIALADMGFAGYNYAAHKLAALPASFVDRIKPAN